MYQTLLTAHSGCDGTEDNTLESIAYALGLDVDCVEADVRRGVDGALVLSHDAATHESAHLEDALAMLRAQPSKKINCDLKEPGLELSVWALAKKMGVGEQLVFSGTVSHHAARVEPYLFSHVDWYLNLELVIPDLSPFGDRRVLAAPGLVDQLRLALLTTGACCINAHYSIANTIAYEPILREGIPLSVWTPGDDCRIRRFCADGVYNITTRNAKRASQVLREISAAEGVV